MDSETLIAARGWELVDNDIAVLKPGVHRPGYAALMAAVERGDITRVVAYGLGRLWRNRRERADGIEFLRRHRCPVTLVKGSDLDLSSAAGRGVGGLMGEFDTMESRSRPSGWRRPRSSARSGLCERSRRVRWRRVRT
jgi:DNA invertase Pin-like site-specific DNA recombinase